MPRYRSVSVDKAVLSEDGNTGAELVVVVVEVSMTWMFHPIESEAVLSSATFTQTAKIPVSTGSQTTESGNPENCDEAVYLKLSPVSASVAVISRA
jgi:hypothetical protein